MKKTVKQTLTLELSSKDVADILSDLKVTVEARLISDYRSPTMNKFVETLKEFRGDYDRVGF